MMEKIFFLFFLILLYNNNFSFANHLYCSASFFTQSSYFTDGYNSLFYIGTSPFTIGGWVQASGSGSSSTILSLSASSGNGVTLSLTSSNNVQCAIGSASTVTSTFSLSSNIWYYVTCVRPTTNSLTLNLYINGVFNSQNSPSGSGLISNTGSLTIMSNFNGRMDQVAVWSSGLSVQNVNQYMAASPLNSPSLAVFWGFDTVTVQTISNGGYIQEDVPGNPGGSLVASIGFFDTCQIVGSESPWQSLCSVTCYAGGGYCYGSTGLCQCYQFYTGGTCSNFVTAAALTTASGSGVTAMNAGVTGSISIIANNVQNSLQVSDYLDTFNITIVGQLSGTSTPSATYVSAGTYSVSYTTNIATVLTVYVSLITPASVLYGVGGPIQGSPFTVIVSPAAIIASNCLLVNATSYYSNSPTGYVAGPLNSAVYVQARDMYNNTISSGGGGTFFFSFSGPSSGTFLSTDASNGKYYFSLSITVTGIYSVSITLGSGGPAISSSPFSWKVIPNGYSASNTYVTGYGLSTGFAGSVNYINVISRDIYNNNRSCPVCSESFQLNIYNVPTSTSVLATNGGALFLLNYTILNAGSYILQILDNNANVIGSNTYTVTIFANVANASLSNIYQGSFINQTAGVQVSFFIALYDSYGNIRALPSDVSTISVTQTGPSLPTYTGTVVLLSASNTFQVTFTPLVSSPFYTLTVNIGGKPIKNSPFAVTVSPSIVTAANSYVYGTGITTAAFAGGLSVFYVQGVDAYGNNATWPSGTNPPFTIILTGLAPTSPLPITISSTDVLSFPGLRSCSFLQYETGVGSMSVTYGSAGLHLSPFTVTVFSAALSLTNSFVTYSAGTRKGVSNFIFNVTLLDAYLNPFNVSVANFNVSLISSPVAQLPTPIVTYYSSVGIAQFSYNTSTLPLGTYTVSITVKAGSMPSYGSLSNSPFQTNIVALAAITSFYPTTSPTTGGVAVTIIGADFTSAGSLCYCKFGSTPSTSVTYVSISMIICVSPPLPLGPITISVSNDGFVTTNSSSSTFSYVNVIGTISATPTTVYSFGGSIIVTDLVSGGGSFVNSPYATCKWALSTNLTNAVIVSTVFTSSTSVTCNAPAIPSGSYLFSVSNEGQIYSNAISMQIIDEQSALCRSNGKLSIEVQDQETGNYIYFPNLALNGNLTTSVAGYGNANQPYQLVDGDRCCARTSTNNGVGCGMKFNISTNALIQFVIDLGYNAYVNEIITSFYNPCRNLPTLFTLEYMPQGGSQYQLILVHDISNPTSTINPRPCYTIPSDTLTTALCIDFFPTVKGSKFRLSFNNSGPINMPQPTDGGWLYEFEVHGISASQPYSLHAFPSQPTVMLANNTCYLPGYITLQALDFNQLAISSIASSLTVNVSLFDSNNNDVSYLIASPLSYFIPQGNSSIIINNINFYNPPHGSYTIVFSNPSIISGTVIVTVTTGLPQTISIVNPQPSQIPNIILQSAVSTVFPSISVGLTDSTGYSLPPQSMIDIFVTSSTGTLQGTLFAIMQPPQITALFSNLALASPLAGYYTLTFTSAGMIPVSATFQVVPGVAIYLRITSPSTKAMTVQSFYQSTLGYVAVQSFDAGGNPSVTYSGLISASCSASSPNCHLSGDVSVVMANSGLATFSNIQLLSPQAGLTQLLFSTPSLSSDTLSVTVVVGTAVGISISTHMASSLPASVTVPFGVINVSMVDAGSNVVTTAAPLLTTVELQQSSAIISGLSGQTSQYIQTGVAIFLNLGFITPPIGVYSLYFTASGLGSASLTFTITLGSPYGLSLLSPTSLSLVSTPIINLGPIIVDVVDGGNNYLGNKDAVTRTISISAASSTVTVVGVTSLNTVASVSARVTFTNLQLNMAKSGSQSMVFKCTGLASTTLPLQVTEGPAYQLSVTISGLTNYTSAPSVTLGDLSIEILDAGGTFIGGAGSSLAPMLVTVLPGVANSLTIQGSTSLLMSYGTVTFSGLQLSFPSAGKYLINATATGLLPGSIYINILPGQAYKVAIANPASGLLNVGVCSSINGGGSGNITTCQAFISGVLIEFMDAGGTIVPITSYSIISVTSPSFATVFQGGNTINAGSTTFPIPNVLVQNPAVGTQTFTISVTNLVSTNLLVTFLPGSPAQLSVKLNNTAVTSFSVGTNISVIAVTAVDIFGNVIKNGLSGQTITLSGVSPLTIGGVLTVTNLGGTSYFSAVKLITGIVGLVSIRATTNGQLTGAMNFQLTSGPPSMIQLIEAPQSQISNGDTLSPILVGITDGIGNLVSLDGATVVLTFSPITCLLSSVPLCDTSISATNTSVNGYVSFYYIALTASPGSTYALTFTNDAAPGNTPYTTLANVSPITIAACDPNAGFNQMPTSVDCECMPGYYLPIGTTQCERCPTASYKNSVGNDVSLCKSCVTVLPNSDTLGLVGQTSPTDCVCSVGYYSQDDKFPNTDCIQCPHGGICPGNTTVTNAANYWESPSNKHQFYSCIPHPVRPVCPANSSVCLKGYTGPECEVCEVGYGGFTNTCEKCFSPGLSSFLIFLMALMLLLILVSLVFLVLVGNAQSQNGAIAMKHYLNITQSLAFLGGLAVAWPIEMESSFDFFAITTLSPRILPIGCTFQLTGIKPLVWYIFLPFIAVVLTFIAYGIYVFVAKRGIVNHGESIPSDMKDFFDGSKTKTLAVSTIIASVLILHPSVTYQVFSMWYCVKIGDNYYEAVDKSEQCNTPAHDGYVAFGVIVFLIYCLGVPLLAFSLFVRKHNDLVRKNTRLFQRLSILAVGYKHNFMWWDFVILSRKFILIAVVVFLRYSLIYSTFCLVVLFLAAVILQLQFEPFQNKFHNQLEIWVIIISYFFAQLAMLLNSNELHNSQLSALIGIIFFLCYTLIIGIFLYMIHETLLSDDARYRLNERFNRVMTVLDDKKEAFWEFIENHLSVLTSTSDNGDAGIVMYDRNKVALQRNTKVNNNNISAAGAAGTDGMSDSSSSSTTNLMVFGQNKNTIEMTDLQAYNGHEDLNSLPTNL